MRHCFTAQERRKGVVKRWDPKTKDLSPFIRLLNVLPTNSGVRRRGIKIHISAEKIRDKFQAQRGRCLLSGLPLLKDRKSIYSMSLDRIDNCKDYTSENTRLVCKAVNMMRGELTDKELLKFCKALVKTMRVP